MIIIACSSVLVIGAVVVLFSRNSDRKTKLAAVVVILIVSVGLVTLFIEARWRHGVVERFVHDCIYELNNGRLPRLNSLITEQNATEIESLKNGALPMQWKVRFVEYFYGTFTYEVRFEDDGVYRCVVDDTSGFLKPFSRPDLSLVEFTRLEGNE